MAVKSAGVILSGTRKVTSPVASLLSYRCRVMALCEATLLREAAMMARSIN